MKVFRLVLLSIVIGGSLLGIETEEVIKKLASDLSNRDFEREAANAIMSEKGKQIVTKELFDALLSAESVETEAAVVGIFLQFDPYPFDALEDLHKTAASSTERAYTLHLMNLGADGDIEIERLMGHAKDSLSDAGVGIRRYGEAAAYSPEGNRPKDVAYNILVVRNGLKGAYPVVNVDNFSLSKRDSLIENLATELGVNLKPKTGYNHETPSETGKTRKQQATRKQFPETDSAAENERTESSRFLIWALAVVVITLLGILLRAFIRGGSDRRHG
jgi:hypothetical protein